MAPLEPGTAGGSKPPPPTPPVVPPADLAERAVPIEPVPAGTRLVRIHRRTLGALHYGRQGGNRFDAPDGGYGVCYLARRLEGAFAETCLRRVGSQLVARSYLAERAWSEILVRRDLRLVPLHGAGLARVGATAQVTSGDYRVAQAWSAGLHAHPARVDGIQYRANHDNGELSVALFERAEDSLVVGPAHGLLDDPVGLAALLERYRVGLV